MEEVFLTHLNVFAQYNWSKDFLLRFQILSKKDFFGLPLTLALAGAGPLARALERDCPHQFNAVFRSLFIGRHIRSFRRLRNQILKNVRSF